MRSDGRKTLEFRIAKEMDLSRKFVLWRTRNLCPNLSSLITPTNLSKSASKRAKEQVALGTLFPGTAREAKFSRKESMAKTTMGALKSNKASNPARNSTSVFAPTISVNPPVHKEV